MQCWWTVYWKKKSINYLLRSEFLFHIDKACISSCKSVDLLLIFKCDMNVTLKKEKQKNQWPNFYKINWSKQEVHLRQSGRYHLVVVSVGEIELKQSWPGHPMWPSLNFYLKKLLQIEGVTPMWHCLKLVPENFIAAKLRWSTWYSPYITKYWLVY